MRIVFMGTPAIAAACMRKLLEGGQELAGVYTKPDTPKNRGMKVAVSEVKAAALEAGLPVYQPLSFRDTAEMETLGALEPELIAVVAYGMLLPRSVLELPAKGCVNIHASLLPALRGAAPVQRAVLNGLSESGVTAQYMTAALDAGDIIAARKIDVGPLETSGELLERMTPLAASLLLETVRSIENGTAVRTPQDPTLVSWAERLDKSMSPIDWRKGTKALVDQVRGLNPWPSATAVLSGKKFKIHRLVPVDKKTGSAPGTALGLTKQGLEIACGDGVVCITELQAEGGRKMRAPDYFRGHPIEIQGHVR